MTLMRVTMTESERMLQRLMDEFDSVMKRKKFKVYVGRNKIMISERAREKTIKFADIQR